MNRQPNEYRNKFSGRRCFIVGSGPSLNYFDEGRIVNEPVIAINSAIERVTFADYSVIGDTTAANKLADLCNTLFTTGKSNNLPKHYLVSLLDLGIWKNKQVGVYGFSEDITTGVYCGNTSAYIALQVACYMGFKEIYFVAVDLDDYCGNTHFDGTYNESGDRQLWFKECNKAFASCVDKLKELGVQVFDCSPLRGITAFPKYELYKL